MSKKHVKLPKCPTASNNQITLGPSKNVISLSLAFLLDQGTKLSHE